MESCNGKSSCRVKASNSVFGDPCYGTYKYLDVTFTCLPAGFSRAQSLPPYTAVSTERVTTCDDRNNVQHLSCGSDYSVISVQKVLYGRADKMPDVICKKDCEINTNVVHTGDPCYGTYKYLDVLLLPACHPDEGQVLFIYGADYGRRDKNTCALVSAFWRRNHHCSRPTSKVAESCNGKRSCKVKVSNSVFGEPCRGTFKYLEVAYRCQ
ncbi:rhamnose-binding lectin-like [Scomber scombrus]